MSNKLWSLKWDKDTLILLDQTKLPQTITYLYCKTMEETANAIRRLAVRGAPAIGVAAAYGMVLALQNELKENLTGDELKRAFHKAGKYLAGARPTAVNLSWAVGEMLSLFDRTDEKNALKNLTARAKEIEAQDRKICEKMADSGAELFKDRTHLNILTHCNTGALATAGIGTAFGVIYRLHEEGRIECVYADETRPLLQGARLTGTELMQNEIPCRLITDNMAAWVMAQKKIDAVIVGADRIASNGDTANKVGTYGLAVLCAYHHIPFYITAPFSTFDFSISSGDEIDIEERDPDEVRKYGNCYAAPENIPVFNPAFDVTPHSLITGIITEKGVLRPPFEVAIKQFERSL